LDIENLKLSTVAKSFMIRQNSYHHALEDTFVFGKVFFNFFKYVLDINDLKA